MSLDVNGRLTVQGSVEVMSELLAGLVGTAATLRLYQASFVPTPSSLEAAFEAAEADFTGYAAVPLVYSAVGIDGGGRIVIMSNNANFQADDDVAPNTIGGAWIHLDDAGPPVVDLPLVYFQFAVPVPMVTALAMMGVKAVMTLPDLNSYAILEV